MTDKVSEPEWVSAALEIEGLEFGELTSTYTREDMRNDSALAGFTCRQCLWPYRPLEVYAGSTVDVSGFNWKSLEIITNPVWFRNDPEQWVTRFTERCSECLRLSQRHQRGKRRAMRAVRIAQHLRESHPAIKTVFVTLTLPNYNALGSGIADLKRKVAAFRRRLDDRIVGGYDFYEWTQNEEDGTYNVHHHGVWIMERVPIKEFTESWGHGWTWLKEVKSSKYSTQNVIQYCIKYAAKDAVRGTRMVTPFGCLYGRAATALEELLKQQDSECSDVAPVPDFVENDEAGLSLGLLADMWAEVENLTSWPDFSGQWDTNDDDDE